MDSTHQPEETVKVKRGLKRKLILSMLLVGALPLIIGLVMAFLQGTKEIREVSGTSFEALASETARKIDLILSDELAHTSQIITDVTIIHTLEAYRDKLADYSDEALQALIAKETQAWDEESPEFIQSLTNNDIVTALRRYYGGTYVDPGHPIPVITRSATLGLFITDIAGRLVATLNTRVPYAHDQKSWWKGAVKNGVGQPYIENVAFNDQMGSYTFTLSLPIMDSIRYQVVGVLHRIYDAKEFFAPSIDTIRFGKTGHVMLIDGHGKVLSCPILPTGTSLSDPDLIPLVTPMEVGWTAAPSDGHGGERSSIIGFAPLPTTSRITQSSTGLGWHMFVWQSSEELFAPIDHLFTWISVFGLLSIALLASLGAIAAGRIVTPIRRLQEAAKLIGRGQWQEPISIKTNDELEELADEMNRMNQQLASTFAGLESEVELKAQEVQYLQESTAQILDSVPDPVIMLNQDQQILYMNLASKEALAINNNGHDEGQPLFHVLKTDPSTTKRLGQEFQLLILDSDKDVSPTDSIQAPSHQSFRDPLQQQSDWNSASEGQEFHMNNQTYRYEWFKIKARPGHDPGIGLVFRDMTEESLLQDRLIKEEKLASLGVLSAGIGHELNNPLVGVIGLGEAIQQEENPNQIKEYAGNIVQHGRRMASIIKDFTGLATSQLHGQLAQVNINEQLDLALHTVKQADETTSSLEIQTNYESLPCIKVNPEELSHVFTNIITNAVQAMRGEGTLNISSRLIDRNIQVTIKDTGPGMPRMQLSKIFDPFFTTKQQGMGAGLGLTIARRIIQKYGGQIQVNSQEGEGTTCQITFPYDEENSPQITEDAS